MNSCCSKSRLNYNSAKGKNRNVRYKYITVPPLTKGLKLDISSLNTTYGVVWYSYDVTLTVKKKGCSDSCDTSLVYSADVINDNSVSFIFDEEFLKLCRGRYEGLISIGCETINCRLDFHVGQYLCISNIKPEQQTAQDGVTPIVDALDIANPNCCVKCEQEKPCGCFDATQQNSMCGSSISCPPEEIKLDVKIPDEECDSLQDWLDGNERTCVPDENFQSTTLDYEPEAGDLKIDKDKLQQEVDKIDFYIETGESPCTEESPQLQVPVENPIVDKINTQIVVAEQKLSKLNQWLNDQNGEC